MSVEKPPSIDDSKSEPGPPLGSWNRVYFAVLANLALLILVFWAFSEAFS